MSDNARTIRMDSLKIHDQGRLRIPSDPRHYFGIEQGDLVTIRLLLSGGTETFQKIVDTKHSVTIPSRIRDEHGLGDGDMVDIEMEVP